MKAKYGEDHQETLLLMYNLAEAYRAAKRLSEPEAIELAKDRLRIVKAKHGPDELPTVTAMMHLAWGYRDSGQIAEAIPLWEEMYRVRKAKIGAGHTDTINVMRSLGSAYRQLGRLTDSLAIRSAALPLIQAAQGTNSDTLTFMSNLANDYFQQGDYARAEPLLLALYDGLAQTTPDEKKVPHSRAQIAERLAQLYHDWNKPDEAAKWRKFTNGR